MEPVLVDVPDFEPWPELPLAACEPLAEAALAPAVLAVLAVFAALAGAGALVTGSCSGSGVGEALRNWSA